MQSADPRAARERRLDADEPSQNAGLDAPRR
jgi:hypothetical protein